MKKSFAEENKKYGHEDVIPEGVTGNPEFYGNGVLFEDMSAWVYGGHMLEYYSPITPNIQIDKKEVSIADYYKLEDLYKLREGEKITGFSFQGTYEEVIILPNNKALVNSVDGNTRLVDTEEQLSHFEELNIPHEVYESALQERNKEILKRTSGIKNTILNFIDDKKRNSEIKDLLKEFSKNTVDGVCKVGDFEYKETDDINLVAETVVSRKALYKNNRLVVEAFGKTFNTDIEVYDKVDLQDAMNFIEDIKQGKKSEFNNKSKPKL